MPKHYIKIELKDKDVIAPVSIAELEEVSREQCKVCLLYTSPSPRDS